MFCPKKAVRDWSLIMGRGGPTKSFEVVLTWELEVLAIVMGGGAKSFHPLKGGGGAHIFTLSWGGAQKGFAPRDFPV